MINLKESKTLTYLRKASFFKDLSKKPACVVLFSQIFKWLSTTQNLRSLYKTVDKVAGRRESLDMHLFMKTPNNSPNDLKILKTFPINQSVDFIFSFVKDVVVPLLLDNEWVLKCTQVFLCEEVSDIF
jgi:hypothetical protein